VPSASEVTTVWRYRNLNN